MPFKYACFISYRWPGHSVGKEFIDQFHEALSGELEGLTDLPICFDKERIKTGDFIDPSIAHKLCSSICMILVYTQTYFSKEHPYCAREYHAMLRLEEKRLALISKHPAESGLIIPIKFRARAKLPSDLERRLVSDFTTFTLAQPDLKKHDKFAEAIREIANRVDEKREQLDPHHETACEGCEDFELASLPEVHEFIDKMASPAPTQGLPRYEAPR